MNLNPQEGCLWFIDGHIVGITEDVPQYGYTFPLNGISDKQIWENHFSKTHTEAYNHYPRCRVVIDTVYCHDGAFESYDCCVFLDKCLDTPTRRKLIYDFCNLGIVSVRHIKWIVLSERTSIDDYTCNWCRNIQ